MAGTRSTKKFRRVEQGRIIKKQTGIPHAIAMAIAKCRDHYEAVEKFPEYCKNEIYCDCCGPEPEICGPNGVISYPWSIYRD